jgi:hypothetical protein
MDHGGSKFISEDRSDLCGQLNCLNHGAPLSLSAGLAFDAGVAGTRSGGLLALVSKD